MSAGSGEAPGSRLLNTARSFGLESGPSLLANKTVAIAVFGTIAVLSSGIALVYPLRPALGIFAALIGTVVVLSTPYTGVLAYYWMAFMRPQDVYWALANTRLTYLISIATLVAALFNFSTNPSLSFLKSKQNFFIVVLWAFILLSNYFGEFSRPDARWMAYYNKMFLIIFVTQSLINNENKLYWLSWVLLISIGYLGIWANQMYFIEGWGKVHGPGVGGSAFYDENDFAMVLVMGIPFLWYMARGHKNFLVRMIMFAWIPIVAHGVMLTFSRGGFLGLAATMGVIALRERSKKMRWAMIGTGVIFFILVAGDEYRNRINSINDYEQDRSSAGRLQSWEAGTRMAMANPIFGVGLRRYVEAFPFYSEFEARQAHNSWVQLGAQCGFIAVSAYGILMYLTFRAYFRSRKRADNLPEKSAKPIRMVADMLIASLVGYLVCGFFLSMEDFELYYLLVAMGIILDRVSSARVREQEWIAEQKVARGIPLEAPAA